MFMSELKQHRANYLDLHLERLDLLEVLELIKLAPYLNSPEYKTKGAETAMAALYRTVEILADRCDEKDICEEIFDAFQNVYFEEKGI
jgi:uncharacterized protein (DUF849 family)